MKRRIARWAMAALILICGTEFVLQLGHLAARGRTVALADPSAPVILCLGDSHTYGAGVSESEAYPARLAALLKERGYHANVVNLGAPGTNTSEIRRKLPEVLKAYHPAVVIVLAGVNNGWNRTDQAWSDQVDGLPVPFRTRAADFLETRVRIVRALYVLFHRLDWSRPPEERSHDRAGHLVIHHREDSRNVESKEATYLRARRDLTAIAAQVRAAHAEPVFMTYVTDPENTFESPNHLMREVARDMNVALADNDRALAPRFIRPDGSVDREARNRLFMPDMHPAPPGYELIAENVYSTLEKQGLLAVLPGPVR